MNKNGNPHSESTRLWRAYNRERYLAASKAYHLSHMSEAKAGNRRRHYKRKYGITEEQFARMVELQGNRCGICGGSEPGGKVGWHLDHDHKTGKLRGILCNSCNLSLGGFHDDIALLESALRYLKIMR